MRAFRAAELLTFSAGQRLALKDSKIAPRAHSLTIVSKEKGGAVVEVKSPVQFKAGEVVGIDGDLAKDTIARVIALDPPASAKTA